MQVSPASQTPLPHTGWQTPQSLGQLEQLSPASQTPLPHTGAHGPQSPGQFMQVSPAWHIPLPHTTGQAPQSPGQLTQFSPVSQRPLPHAAAPQLCPHTAGTCATQALPHDCVQHDGYIPQSVVTHGSHEGASGAPA